MKSKVLTISIAAYNVENYLKNTLESLIVPNIFEELEVLIINDGSIDSTPLIAEQYIKKYPHIFKLVNKENGGYGSTINTALSIASGKYFKQLDGDDWFEKENLNEFIEFLKVSVADCVYSPYWKVYQNKGKKILSKAVSTSENRIEAGDISMHALTFKTDIFLKNHITITENCFYTDCEYNIKPLVFVRTIEYFERPVYCYRLGISGQSVSKEGWAKHYNEHNQVTLEIMSYYMHHKEQMTVQNQSAIERYILTIYKANFYVALEMKDKMIQERYRQLDLKIMTEFPMFVTGSSMKMVILRQSKYKAWKILRVLNKILEKNRL